MLKNNIIGIHPEALQRYLNSRGVALKESGRKSGKHTEVENGCKVTTYNGSAGGWSISVPVDSKPMSPELRARYDKVKAFKTDDELRADWEKSRKAKELAERLERVRQFDPGPVRPNSVDSLDANIRMQLDRQPREHRAMLSKLYKAFCMYNGAFFGGDLKLPILTVGDLQSAVACCYMAGAPTEIKFDATCLKSYAEESLHDVLLHEMLHQCVKEFPGGTDGDEWDTTTRGHGKRFTDIANAIAKVRGWPCVTHEDMYGHTSSRFWPPRPYTIKR